MNKSFTKFLEENHPDYLDQYRYEEMSVGGVMGGFGNAIGKVGGRMMDAGVAGIGQMGKQALKGNFAGAPIAGLARAGQVAIGQGNKGGYGNWGLQNKQDAQQQTQMNQQTIGLSNLITNGLKNKDTNSITQAIQQLQQLQQQMSAQAT